MPNYEITLHLVSGQSVQITREIVDLETCTKNVEQNVNSEICRLTSKADSSILVIRNPRENVIAYFVDRV